MAAPKDQQKEAEAEGLSATTLLPKLIPSGAGREWLERRRATIRPWGAFVDQRRFSRPRNLGELCQRLVRNVEYYQSNYVFVFLGLILYCVVTSPMLLVALAVFFGACYILYLRTLQSKLVLFALCCGLGKQWRTAQVLGPYTCVRDPEEAPGSWLQLDPAQLLQPFGE